MLEKVESFNVMPIMPDSLPDTLPIFQGDATELTEINEFPPIEELSSSAEPLSYEATQTEESTAAEPFIIPIVEQTAAFVPETAKEPNIPQEISAEPTFNTEFSQIGFAPIEENIQKTKENDDQIFFSFEPVKTPDVSSQPFVAHPPQSINSTSDVQGASRFSEIKSSLDEINKKVIEKKSTPYI